MDWLQRKVKGRKFSRELPPALSLLDIERRTQRDITIATDLTDANLLKCNLQHQSALFKLPAELRNIIWSLVAQPSDDPAQKYHERDFCYRPGHHAKHVHDTAVLQTCRRVWLEAHALPMLQAEHCFWFRDLERRPLWCQSLDLDEIRRFRSFLRRLSHNGVRSLFHIHVFAQMIFIDDDEGGSGIGRVIRLLAEDRVAGESLIAGPIVPKIFTLTVRHFDWWGWENGQRLELKIPSAVALLRRLDRLGVETFRLELETLGHKRPQLEPILTSLREMDGPRTSPSIATDVTPDPYEEPDSYLVLQQGHQEASWSGPVDGPWPNRRQYAGMERLDYRVVTLTWKRQCCHSAKVPEAGRRARCSDVVTPAEGMAALSSHLLEPTRRSTRQVTTLAGSYEREWALSGSLLKFVD
jgi:hypothetical protein